MGKLNESGLSRVWKHSQDHDIGTITAFRHDDACGDGVAYTKAENKARNKSLQAKLQAKGYGITKASGVYIENYGTKKATPVKEEIFIVVDLKDRGTLKKDLKAFGNEFEQDSILYIKKGGTSGDLIGTGDCPDLWIPKGKTNKLKNAIFGEKGEFYTRVNGRPFTLKENVEKFSSPPEAGFFSSYGVYLAAKKDWREMLA